MNLEPRHMALTGNTNPRPFGARGHAPTTEPPRPGGLGAGLKATLRLGHPCASAGSHGGFSAGERHDRAGPPPPGPRWTLPFPRCSPPPSAQRSGRLPGGGAGPGPCGARGRAGPARDAAGATPAGEPSPGAAPGPGRPPIGRLGVTPLYRETRLAAAAACAPALALYAEPPAGPLTMGGASARALGPS